MNIKGVIIPNEDNTNTVEATKFALRYFKGLENKTTESSVDDGFLNGDVVVVSIAFVGNTIATGYESTVQKLDTDIEVVWVILLIQDDTLEKGSILVDDFIKNIKQSKHVYLERFTEMTSEKYVPLQTKDMMQIMNVCDLVQKKFST